MTQPSPEEEKQGETPEPDADVTRLFVGDREVILVGTAHVSRVSAEKVERIIREEKPDTVCVELCPARYQALVNPEAWREMDIVKVIREKRAHLLLSHLLLASFQKRLADRLDIRAGAEMLAAVNAAKETGAQIAPIDREIRTTLARAWGSMSWRSRFRLLYELLTSLGEADSLTEEDIEALKEKDALELMLKELSDVLPELRRVLIDERDLVLGHGMKNAPGKKIVAVVGAGHVPGILANWDRPVDIAPLLAEPLKGKAGKVIKWGLPTLVIALMAAGFFHAGTDAGVRMLGWWVAANGILGGLGAILALAHPLSILTAVVAAPITSLNPMLAAGWFSGLVEASLRKPRVLDFETLGTDITTVSGFWKNKVTRILLVVVLTNLGSMAGTFVALPAMIRIFGLSA
ncbi:MAG: TraB/GumN family protein [Proteobacteria bacterium]|nr:TraB/GumN family protein [Pseudomonadota bacterium]